MNIKFNDTKIFPTSEDLVPNADNLKRLEDIISQPQNGYAASVYLTATTGGSWGIAKIASICDKNKKGPRSMNRWEVSDIFTAQTVAHEIGHNLGYFHDFDETTVTGRKTTCGPVQWKNGPHNDLMNYAANFELKQNKWSDCTNEDFRNYFGRVTSEIGSNFCLEKCDTSLKVGSEVVPNLENKSYGNKDGGIGSIGRIISKKESTIEVEWENGTVSDYSFGSFKKIAVRVICDVTSENCQHGKGEDYYGSVSETKSGFTCKKWSS